MMKSSHEHTHSSEQVGPIDKNVSGSGGGDGGGGDKLPDESSELESLDYDETISSSASLLLLHAATRSSGESNGEPRSQQQPPRHSSQHRRRQRVAPLGHGNVVHTILCEQDLSRAGSLFSFDNDQLLRDFATTVELLKSIVDHKSYAGNLNQQSIVEIVLTKCIAALRETNLIVNYYEDLLELIEICLKFNLNSSRQSGVFLGSDDDGTIRSDHRLHYTTNCDSAGGAGALYHASSPSSGSTPHANIVSDILSCILLDYLDPELTSKTVPVCVRLIQHHSVKRELLRQVCSYLNLVAMRLPELLVDYVVYIVSAIAKGQHCLSHLLYQICEANIECIYPLTRHLIKCLHVIPSVADINYILQIMYLISLSHVQLVVVHLEDLVGFLIDDHFQDFVLDIMYSVASQLPIALEPYLGLFDKRHYFESPKVDKIIGTVGRSLKKKSEYCAFLLIEQMRSSMEATNHLSMRKSNSLNSSRGAGAATVGCHQRAACSPSERVNNENAETVVGSGAKNLNTDDHNGDDDSATTIGGEQRTSAGSPVAGVIRRKTRRGTGHVSVTSRCKKSNSYSYNPRTTTHHIHGDEAADFADPELAAAYARANQRCAHALAEIGAIAQAHPDILETCLRPIQLLFPHPNDTIRMYIDRLHTLKHQSSSAESDDLLDTFSALNLSKKTNTKLLRNASQNRSSDAHDSAACSDRGQDKHREKQQQQQQQHKQQRAVDLDLVASISNMTSATESGDERELLTSHFNSDRVQIQSGDLTSLLLTVSDNSHTNTTNNKNISNNNNNNNNNISSCTNQPAANNSRIHEYMRRLEKDLQFLSEIKQQSSETACDADTKHDTNVATCVSSRPSTQNEQQKSDDPATPAASAARTSEESQKASQPPSPPPRLTTNAALTPEQRRGVQQLSNRTTTTQRRETALYDNELVSVAPCQPISDANTVTGLYENVAPTVATEQQQQQQQAAHGSCTLPANKQLQLAPPTPPSLLLLRPPTPGRLQVEQKAARCFDSPHSIASDAYSIIDTSVSDTKNAVPSTLATESTGAREQRNESPDAADRAAVSAAASAAARRSCLNMSGLSSVSVQWTADETTSASSAHARDVVHQFCAKHLDKIRSYVRRLCALMPLPTFQLDNETLVSVTSRSECKRGDVLSKTLPNARKKQRRCTINFTCAHAGALCLYGDGNVFRMPTTNGPLWIHTMFLVIQAQMSRPISQHDREFTELKLFYERLAEKQPFVTLVTSSFPSEKQLGQLVDELREARLFDLFARPESIPLLAVHADADGGNSSNNNTDRSDDSNAHALDAGQREQHEREHQCKWQCYLCLNPDKANTLMDESQPLIKGQLKEKHGKWKWLRRWHKRFFTLTSGNIIYFKKDMRQESLHIKHIRSIQAHKKSTPSPMSKSKPERNVTKAFEIITDRNSFVLKAQNSSDAQQWVRYLQICKALEQSRSHIVNKEKTEEE